MKLKVGSSLINRIDKPLIRCTTEKYSVFTKSETKADT